MNISELLNLTYEVEGLLLLLQDRGNSAPSSIKALVAQKSAQLAAETATAVGEVTTGVSVATASPTMSGAQVAQVANVAEVAEIANVGEVAGVESVGSVDSAIVDPAVNVAEEAVITPVAVVTPAEVVAPMAVVAETEMVTDIAVEVSPKEAVIDVEPAVSVAEVAELPEVAVVEPKAMSVEKGPFEKGPVEEETVDEDALAVEPIRLDEKLAREGSRDLRKAFSLNDRFRFRRELFGNSDIEMTDTLNIVEAMTNYAEAVDYFMSDLQWDEENPDVADFLAIIQKHFATR